MEKESFFNSIVEKPTYVDCKIYKKINNTWILQKNWMYYDTVDLKNITKGPNKPLDNEGEYGDIYIQTGDKMIEFTKYDEKFSMISAKHYGWQCPSMYRDKVPENGNCDIYNQYWDPQFGIWRSGLFLKFTTDDYSERVYLVLEVLNKNAILIVYDDMQKENILLLKTSVIYQNEQ